MRILVCGSRNFGDSTLLKDTPDGLEPMQAGV
jgi:hypothetical protein